MAETTTKRHPIRAAIWGLILGLGVVIYLTLVFPVISLESVSQVATQGVIVIVVVMVLSILWGMYGPAKKPKGSPPPTFDAAAVSATPAAADEPAADTGDDPASDEPTGDA